MKYFVSSHFEKCFKKLGNTEKERSKSAITALTKYFDKGIKPIGIGLKRLQDNIWEIRVSIKMRLLFSFEKDEITFIIIGNHDEIRKYLKRL